MKVKTYVKDGVEIVEPRGKLLGGAETRELDEKLYALLGRGVKAVVIDLGSTDWMNSDGLAILVRHFSTFRDKGCDLVLANLTNKVEQILVISRLTTVFQTHESLDQAVASFKGKKK